MSLRVPLLLLLACAGARAATTASEFTLDNGLRLIVQEDHRAPVAVVMVWYRVGGSFEADGSTGLSHALEHMMFKRTRKLPTGEFSRVVAARGGRENAFTSADYTAYFQHWAADNVATSFEFEAERMLNLVLDPDEFANEMKVIREERRLRTDDDPHALAYEAVLAHTWQTSPYRQPVIGWGADIEQLTRAELEDWYRRHYVPNNAIVVVVGDVQPATVHELAEQHFGALPARKVPPAKFRPEVPQQGEKRLEIRSPRLRLPMLVMHFKVPGYARIDQPGPDGRPVEAWEIPALDMLAATLDGGASARFPRELERGSQIALQAGATYASTSRLEDLFSFDGVPREGTTLESLEAAIREQIARLKANPPSEQELARIKTGVAASNVYQRDSLFSRAMMLGSLAVVGLDWRLMDTYLDAIAAVTPAQVQAVARRYLRDEVATVAYLLPEQAHD